MRKILVLFFSLFWILSFSGAWADLPGSIEVWFTTDDEVKISASWTVPAGEKKGKKIPLILVHHFGGSRVQWDAFTPAFLEKGYAVLAIDLRGHGKSISKGKTVLNAKAPDFLQQEAGNMVWDIKAAIKWLKTQPQIEGKKIGIIGGDLGANVAFVSAGTFKEIRAAVALSPGIDRLIGVEVKKFNPKSILFMATLGDGQGASSVAAEGLANMTEDPKETKIYRGKAHGIAILYGNPEAQEDIFAWLEQRLGP
ncbi:MAG TPA: alpha/beta fold hydrolase [Candidatus Limnocylindrales bacterium]|nr:alpha/beta fold hydrolase [Candidatus Limnocylindrales bacterium]